MVSISIIYKLILKEIEMDPNNNPTPTPNPEPMAPPMPEPIVPETPGAPSAPTTSEAPAAPAEPVVPNPEPVNPVIQPSGNPVPVNPVIQPGAQGGLAATDPIMQPERPPEPDPVEEELKAPMQPAGPVPGSIGSAVSGPNESATAEAPNAPAESPFAAPQTQTPSVSFNDPAAQPASTPATKPAGKSNKTTLIVLIAVAAVIVVVLVIVLIMSLMSGNSSTSSNQSNNSELVIDNDNEGNGDNTDVTTGTLSCTRNMTQQELIGTNDAVSGVINITAEFDESIVVAVSRVDSVVYSDEDGTETEPVETEVHEAKTADMTAESAMNYFLAAGTDGQLDLSVDAVQANYEDLDFTCEVL